MILCWRCIIALFSFELAQCGQQGHGWLLPHSATEFRKNAIASEIDRSAAVCLDDRQHHGSNGFQSANCTFIIGTAKGLAWNLPDGLVMRI
jgi:hypothetical protein